MRRIISSGVTLMLLCLLAACGSPPASDTTGTQPDASSPTAPTEAATTTVVATTLPPTPSAEASASSTETTKASEQSSLDLIASLTRSGGLQGRTQTLLVRKDGTVVLLNGERGGAVLKTAQATPAQLQALQALLASAEWQQLDERYGGQAPDGFMYTVTGGGLRVTTYDGTQNPPALENVLGKLNELWQAAERGS